jgi:DNA polymerase V
MHTGLSVTRFYSYRKSSALALPLFLTPIRAGFPSPAEDWIDANLDLSQHLIRHPAASFFVRVAGTSMLGAGIHPGDLLLVDRALKPANNQVIIAVVDGEFTVKRLRRTASGRIFLVADNPDFPPLEIKPDTPFEVWGVVTYVIHSV